MILIKTKPNTMELHQLLFCAESTALEYVCSLSPPMLADQWNCSMALSKCARLMACLTKTSQQLLLIDSANLTVLVNGGVLKDASPNVWGMCFLDSEIAKNSGIARVAFYPSDGQCEVWQLEWNLERGVNKAWCCARVRGATDGFAYVLVPSRTHLVTATSDGLFAMPLTVLEGTSFKDGDLEVEVSRETVKAVKRHALCCRAHH